MRSDVIVGSRPFERKILDACGESFLAPQERLVMPYYYVMSQKPWMPNVQFQQFAEHSRQIARESTEC